MSLAEIPKEISDLIRSMSRSNPLWGAPRIHGELLKLGISVSQAFVFLLMSNDRWNVIHFNVTDSPTAVWTVQQIVNAFPWDTAPRYVLRDRDAKFGEEFN